MVVLLIGIFFAVCLLITYYIGTLFSSLGERPDLNRQEGENTHEMPTSR
ncbi:MAG: hypothetical protein ABI615_03440 [Chthoniobacterales bacterium]